jgi:DNA-directed RNA polymerase specialized sigma24 family protein
MSEQPRELPENPDELAAWIVGQQDRAAIERGLSRLEPFIRQRARRKALNYGLPPHEFADEAFSRIGLDLFLRRFDPARGYRFTSYLYMRLEALAKDELRRRKRREQQDPPVGNGSTQTRVTDLIEAPEPGGNVLDTALVAVAREPFSLDDLARIEDWPPFERLLVLALAGWHRRVPDGDWQRWRIEAGLAAPFPPAEVIECDDAHQRVGLLDQRLDHDVAQFWVRKQLRLLELDATWQWLRAAAPLTEPWGQADVERVESWLPLARIVLLAVSSLWARLPQWRCWSEWQNEAGIGAAVPVLLLVRKSRLAERLATLQRKLPKRLCADAASLWHAESRRLDGLGRWPFPPREE